MSTKETIINSCNNLYKNNVITRNQLKSCMSIDSDYKKKNEYTNKVLGDDISQRLRDCCGRLLQENA